MTETRRLMVEDLAKHLSAECGVVLKRHVRVMAASCTPHEGMMIIVAGSAQFLLNALNAAVVVSAQPGEEAALYARLVGTVFAQLGEDPEQVGAEIREVRSS